MRARCLRLAVAHVHRLSGLLARRRQSGGFSSGVRIEIQHAILQVLFKQSSKSQLSDCRRRPLGNRARPSRALKRVMLVIQIDSAAIDLQGNPRSLSADIRRPRVRWRKHTRLPEYPARSSTAPGAAEPSSLAVADSGSTAWQHSRDKSRGEIA